MTIIHAGTQERILAQVTTAAGSTEKQGTVQTDSLLVSLWVSSVSSGTLTVSVYTLTDEGKEVQLFSFPVLSAPTSSLLLKKSGVSMQRFRIVATYTGVCDYEIYVRAIEGAGESSVRLLGGNGFRVTQISVPATATELLPAALTDRTGIIIKNWSTSTNLYIAETSAKATSAAGYPVAPRDNVTLDVAAGVAVWAIAESGTVDVRLGEAGN